MCPFGDKSCSCDGGLLAADWCPSAAIGSSVPLEMKGTVLQGLSVTTQTLVATEKLVKHESRRPGGCTKSVSHSDFTVCMGQLNQNHRE